MFYNLTNTTLNYDTDTMIENIKSITAFNITTIELMAIKIS